jgi:Uma2 family endonuclease
MAAQAALVSISEYLVREERARFRHEFVGGIVYAMAGASRNHSEISSQLFMVVGVPLRGRPCRILGPDTKVFIERADAIYYPDASVSCPPNHVSDSSGMIDNPTAVFEILSASTALVDEGPKFSHYRLLPSLSNYVLIDSRKMHVRVFSLEGGEWVVRSYESPDDVANVDSIGISLPLGELYEHAVLEPGDEI